MFCHVSFTHSQTVVSDTALIFPAGVKVFSPLIIHCVHFSLKWSLKGLFRQTSSGCTRLVKPPGMTAWVERFPFRSCFAESPRWALKESQTRRLLELHFILSPVANKLFVNSKFTTCFWVARFFCKLHNYKFELCCVFMTLVTCRRHCSDAEKVPVFLSVLAFICMPWPKANIGSKTKNADVWGNIQIKNRLTNDNWAASSCTWPVAWRNWEACTLLTRSMRKLKHKLLSNTKLNLGFQNVNS